MADILIFGSEGFIGSNLASYYIRKGWKVSGIDRFDNPSIVYDYNKLLTMVDVAEFLAVNHFDYIINAAGNGNVGFSVKHPLSDFESNCFETAGMLDAIRASGSKPSYVHISSAAVYGNPNQLPISEDSNLNPLSPYGWNKLISELLCKEYSQLNSLKCCIVRPFSVYGPGLRKQLFWDIYHRAVGSKAVELFGTGRESRDFIYISDLVGAIDIIVESAPMTCETYNLASGFENSIHTVADLFLNEFNPKPSLIFNGLAKAGDPLNWRADISKINRLGFKTSISIEEGIHNTFNWINRSRDSFSGKGR